MAEHKEERLFLASSKKICFNMLIQFLHATGEIIYGDMQF
jgi:hypothetical protein